MKRGSDEQHTTDFTKERIGSLPQLAFPCPCLVVRVMVYPRRWATGQYPPMGSICELESDEQQMFSSDAQHYPDIMTAIGNIGLGGANCEGCGRRGRICSDLLGL